MVRNVMIRLSLLLLFIVSSAGCAALMANFGTIDPEGHITKEFEGFKVNPDYQYFVTGSYVYPHALIGLDKRFILRGNLWTRVDMTQETMKEMVISMQRKALEVGWNLHLYGFAIRDKEGRQIGVWYSILKARTAVKIEGNEVDLYPPPLDIYEIYEIERTTPS